MHGCTRYKRRQICVHAQASVNLWKHVRHFDFQTTAANLTLLLMVEPCPTNCPPFEPHRGGDVWEMRGTHRRRLRRPDSAELKAFRHRILAAPPSQLQRTTSTMRATVVLILCMVVGVAGFMPAPLSARGSAGRVACKPVASRSVPCIAVWPLLDFLRVWVR